MDRNGKAKVNDLGYRDFSWTVQEGCLHAFLFPELRLGNAEQMFELGGSYVKKGG
jgi:hypothetical protein